VRLNEKKLRSIVRKKILLEQEKMETTGDPVDAGAQGAAVPRADSENKEAKVEQEVDTEATEAHRAQLKAEGGRHKKGCRPGVGLGTSMTLPVARELAEALYEATEGGGDGFWTGLVDTAVSITGQRAGIGTDGAAVKKALSDDQIQSALDISYIARVYGDKYSGENLTASIADDYSDMYKQERQGEVIEPLEDIYGKGILLIGENAIDSDSLNGLTLNDFIKDYIGDFEFPYEAKGSAVESAWDGFVSFAKFSFNWKRMLSPDIYEKFDIFLKELGKQMLEDVKSDASLVYKGDELVGGGGDIDTIPALPSDIDGLSSDNSECIMRIQKIMNAYIKVRNIAGDSINPDGVWGEATQGFWEDKFIKHVFGGQGHKTFREMPIAANVVSGSTLKWTVISSSLVGTYPSYTSNVQGCLAFCLDAYYNNNKYGKAVTSGSDTDRIIGGDSSKKKNSGDNQSYNNANMSTGTRGAKDILISTQFDIDSGVDVSMLKQKFPDLHKKLTDRLVTNMKEFDIISGRSGKMVDTETTFELMIKVKRGKVKVKRDRTVRKISGNRPGRNFGKLTKTVEAILNNDRSVRDDLEAFDGLKMQITLPRGKYASSVNENQALRKLVRKVIIKQLLK